MEGLTKEDKLKLLLGWVKDLDEDAMDAIIQEYRLLE